MQTSRSLMKHRSREVTLLGRAKEERASGVIHSVTSLARKARSSTMVVEFWYVPSPKQLLDGYRGYWQSC